MDLKLFSLIISIIPFGRSMVYACHETSFKIDGYEYNVNHLKNHLPPYQKYTDKSNFFGISPSDQKKYIFFNIADFVKEQEIDKSHHITKKCFPRTKNIDPITNLPVACIPADQDECESSEVCWVALGSCKDVSYQIFNGSLVMVYSGGDFPDKKFAVKINCCKDDHCLSKYGLDSPIKFESSSCYQKADYCVELNSPYGCNCDTRKKIDLDLNQKEFQCDATPHGLSAGLSTGSWLLIFFFTITGMYFGVGIVYNCSDGHKGTESIPHLEMWKDLGSLICEGFMFVKSCGEYRDGFQYSSI